MFSRSHVNEAAGNKVGGDHYGLYTDYSEATDEAHMPCVLLSKFLSACAAFQWSERHRVCHSRKAIQGGSEE